MTDRPLGTPRASRASGLGSPRVAAALALAGLALAGCGASRPAGGSAHPDAAAAAVAPGVAKPGPALQAQEAAIHRQVLAALHDQRYAHARLRLPASVLRGPVHRTVTATAAHPALGVEGDTVRLLSGGAETLTTLIGPQVPPNGPGIVPAVPASFVLELRGTRGRLALEPRDFTVHDQYGHVHLPALALAGGGALPAAIRSGQRLRLLVRALLPAGGGELRWAPGGRRALVSWDFTVETD